MPKIKKPYKNIKNYTECTLQNALEAVRLGMPKQEAAKKYKVPRQTIQGRISGRVKKARKGPETVLTTAEEDEIVNWIIESHRKGFPRRKVNIQTTVKDFLDKSGRHNPFKENMPGEKWYKSFLNRHPIIIERVPEAVTAASARVSETDIKNWFDNVFKELQSDGYDSILSDPTRIYNGDETNFLLCPKTGKVLAPKGSRNVFEVDKGQAKENLTVMFTFAASGEITPPLIVYPYKRIPANVVQHIPKDWGFALSESGWMKTDIFINYIKNVLHPHLQSRNVEFPIILFLDGHKSHLSVGVSELCTRLKIVLVCLYPNATRMLQPADVTAFKPLKAGWKKAILEFRTYNPDVDVTKAHVAPILQKAITTHLHPTTIKNGFKACGLYPFNKDAIDFSRCLGKNQVPKSNNVLVQSRNICSAITFQNFRDIIGGTKLQELENFSNSEATYPEDFILLYEIYRKFTEESQLELTTIDESEEINLEIAWDDAEDLHVNSINEKAPLLHTTANIAGENVVNEPIPTEANIIEEASILNLSNEQNFRINDLPVLFLSTENNGSEVLEIKDYFMQNKTPEKKGLGLRTTRL